MQNGAVRSYNLREAHNLRLVGVCIPQAEKLPAVVVLVVSNVQYGFGAVEYAANRDDRAIPRLVERPVISVRRGVHGLLELAAVLGEREETPNILLRRTREEAEMGRGAAGLA